MTHFPVLVTMTDVHVAWIEADSQAEAVGLVRDDGPAVDVDPAHSATRVDCDFRAEAPTDMWDLSMVTDGGSFGYDGTPYDAHVKAHRSMVEAQERAARRETCTAAGHPIVGGRLSWKDYCDTCGPIDPVARTAVSYTSQVPDVA